MNSFEVSNLFDLILLIWIAILLIYVEIKFRKERKVENEIYKQFPEEICEMTYMYEIKILIWAIRGSLKTLKGHNLKLMEEDVLNDK